MGLLIAIEGGEYTGKTSVVIPSLHKIFSYCRIPHMTSREPGGTPKGEKMRVNIFHQLEKGISPLEQAKLFNKARELHIRETLIPFLGKTKKRKALVVVDRYLDSTRVYQGLEGGVSFEKIYQLEKKYVHKYFPDITLVYYFPEAIFTLTFLERMRSARQIPGKELTAFDTVPLKKHLQRQKNYFKLKEIAEENNEKRLFAYINAAQKPYDVVKDTIDILAPHLYPTYIAEKKDLSHALLKNNVTI